jgi:hypothetical protein
MSVANIINPIDNTIYPSYIPWGLNPNVPDIATVLQAGNDAQAEDLTNCGAITSDTVAANNITGGEMVVDGGVGKPAFLRNTNQNRLTLVGENNDVPTSELETGKVILKGTGGTSTATLTTSGNALLVNGVPVGGGGGVGTLGQVLATGNDGGGVGMTNIGQISATGVSVGGNPVYTKAFFPGVGTAGSDPEQRLPGSSYVIPTDNATLLTALNSAPGQVVFISASSPAQTLDLTSLPGVGSLIANQSVLYFMISDTSQPITFTLKTGVAELVAQPGESVRVLYQSSYGGWKYIGM